MTCLRENEQGADLLIGYLEDTLSPEAREEIELHAAICADCRELLEVQDTLDEIPVPEVSPDFDERLYARIAEEEAKPRGWTQRWVNRGWWDGIGTWMWRPALPLAAAAALVAAVLWVKAPAPPVDPEPGSFTKASVDIDPQQLEQALEDLELLMPMDSM